MPGKLCRTGRTRAVAVVFLLLAGWRAAQAQPQSAFLVKDLDPSPPAPVSRSPLTQAALGGWVYFSAQDPQHGNELWRTDGTAAGTELFLDLCPGDCSSQPYTVVALGGRLFFSADDGVHGREPWVSDGTRTGTHLLYDVCPGACDSLRTGMGVNTPWIVAAGGAFLFTARDGTAASFQLWRTDGTSQGTARVATDLSPPEGRLTAFAGQLYYISEDGRGPLVRSDGTAAGTVGLPVACVRPCFFPLQIVVATDSHLLVVDENPTPAAAWTIDRSGAIQPFSLLCSGACYGWTGVAAAGGAYVSSGNGSGASLWWTDFTLGGKTVRLQDFPLPPTSLTAVGSRLFFVLFGNGQPSAVATGLWTSDGTPAGTVPLNSVVGVDLTPFAGGVLFGGFGADQRQDPWWSDGTLAGTRPVATLDPDVSQGSLSLNFIPLGTQAIFTADRFPLGARLWRTDGTAAGTSLLQDLGTFPASSSPRGLRPIGGSLYFTAEHHGEAPGLWKSDGTAAGTVRLHGASSDGTSTAPTLLGDRLFFADFVPTNYFPPSSFSPDPSLFVSDGDAASAYPVGGGAYPRELTQVGGDVFFLAGTEFSGTGPSLFVLPAGSAEARIVAVNDASRTAPVPGRVHDLTPLGGKLLLGGSGDPRGDELWISGGTAAGTAVVADLCPRFCSSHPSRFLAMGSFALFATVSDEQGAGLWRTDGTAAGTLKLTAFPGNPELGGAGPREPVLFSGRAYFLVTLPARDELWTSDGTAAGTRRVSTLDLDGSPARAHRLTTAGRLLFLAVYHQTTGEELWASDGTALGTRLVADLNPGPASGAPQHLSTQGDRLFFSASDGRSGFEPWTSDGTPLGTSRLADVAPGADSANPVGFTLAGDRLFWSADDGVHGRELWALPSTALATPLCRTDDTTLCLLGRFAVTLAWKANGGQGAGHAVGRSSESGLFWFFDPDNPEILVKLLNGSGVNGSYWFFSGALSDVEYRVTVKDLATGLTRTYDNPHGRICGQADTAAFPAPHPAEAAAAPAAWTAPAGPDLSSSAAYLSPAPGCQAGPQTLCLADGRFRVEAAFAPDRSGAVALPATALPAGDRSGFFWFFDGGNLELAVKVVDGTALNGHNWFFYGALSDVAYTITVTDTVTGTQKTYRNPPGNFCGGGDTTTF